ncbi:MAG: apurinic endonuclease Apn1 [Acidimicrobiaceae bacterium]|nr:apurinic endonuclease Apn1 [Acidimicrobiaceae bacterium]
MDAIQIFTQSPRMWRSPSHPAEVLAAYRATQATHPSVRATFCHATYLINLASDGEIGERSRRCLVENLVAATAIGAKGLVLHVGSHRGAGLDGCLAGIGAALREALEATEGRLGEPACPLLLENAAGTGGTVGRSFEELALLLEAAGGDQRLGVCLDTQHLFASGVPFGTIEEADAALAALDAAVGLERLACLHLNDSKVPFGANRDRHENLGEGEIGEHTLSCLLGHPALARLPALLEVPGSGDGPRVEDVAVARRVIAEGIAMRGGRALLRSAPARGARPG